MRLACYIGDAFAEKAGNGNPAGVVLYDSSKEYLSDEQMKIIALEIGKSETAFVDLNNNSLSIRWFSPKKEMPLCGHATLVASKVLNEVYEKKGSLVFSYNNGRIVINNEEADNFDMIFPIDQYKIIEMDSIFNNFFPTAVIVKCIYGTNTKKVVLILDNEVDIETIKPNYQLMKDSIGIFQNGIGISQRSKMFDFESRYFNPWAGVDEDPVTGSVHTLLGNYWSMELNKNELLAVQKSYRPGIIKLRINNDKIHIIGKAKIVFYGFVDI